MINLCKLLRAVEDELIVLALKGAPRIKNKILVVCLSVQQQIFKIKMEALDCKIDEVQEAQKQIIAVARRMSDEGSIVLVEEW